MKNNLILVASHPRAGTHFLINSLCDNSSAIFPLIREAYPSVERLLISHDAEFTTAWEEYLKDEITKIIKTHLLPSDIMKAINTKGYLTDADKTILETIWRSAKKVYIQREGKDVLVSWYYLQKDKGAGLFADGKLRLSDCTFSEFIRMPNNYYMPIRGFENKDKNRVTYLFSHVNEWKQTEDIISITYEDLYQNFDITMKKIITKLNLKPNHTITRPRMDRWTKRTLLHKIARRIRVILYPQYKTKWQYPRKGIIGDWKNHFSKDDLEFFNANYCEG